MQFFRHNYKEQVERSIQSIKALAKHFILGLLIEMGIVALLNSILLTVFGIQHSIIIALLAAVLNIIPYVGIYSATLLSVLITYANSNSTTAITAGLILLSVHIVDANFIMPKIMGSQVKLNSFAVLLAVITGGFIWGIPGMFLFVPLVAIARIVLEEIPSCRPIVTLLGEP
jgi:predicted PurR-regulated permease PerM